MGAKKPFPKTISFKKLLGPSFIILALGLGSGEVILWPFLVATYGLGIALGALLGITFQYFMNMEIERSLDPNNDGDLVDAVDVISLSIGGEAGPYSPMSIATNRAMQDVLQHKFLQIDHMILKARKHM